MKTRLRILSVLIVALLVSGCGWWVWRAKRQYALNRQLIAALEHNDTTKALALVNQGADPNTRQNPPPAPTLKLLFNQLLHRSACTDDKLQDTALHLAVSGHYINNETTFVLTQQAPALWKFMLAHGAQINARGEYAQTPLHEAASVGHVQAVAWLLHEGADINMQDSQGWTPLMYAVNTGNSGYFHYAASVACVRLLLACHPSLALKTIADSRHESENVLSLAKDRSTPEIVHLLQQAGAKE